jgi:drug/metabolite transporter (DMT)-like permease
MFSKADRYLIAITVIWGSTFSVTKFALDDLSPLFLQGTRFALAAVMVGIYTFRDIRTSSRSALKAGLILGLLLGGGFALQTVGLVYTTASKAGFLTGTMVVFTPLFQVAIERRMPSRANMLGVVIVATGLFLFTMPGEASFNIGDALVLGCAVIFALYIVFLDVFTRDGFQREIVFYQFVVTAVMGFTLSPLFSEAPPVWNVDSFAAVFYLALFASTIAIFLQSRYQRETTPTRAAIIFSLEPVFAAVIALFALGEMMKSMELTGAAVMFTGLLLSELMAARERNRA